jgi:PAS domain S-box-containing protein
MNGHSEEHPSGRGSGSARPASPDPNATGASDPLPGLRPGVPGREHHEREAVRRRRMTPARARPDVGPPPELAQMNAYRMFALLADHVRDYAVFLMNPDGIISYWGEGARLMKWWTPEEVVGAHLRVLYPDSGSEDGTAETHLQMAADFGEYTGEGQRVRSDGSTFWAGVTLTALRDDEQRLVGFCKVTRDFSARRAIEATLRGAAAATEAQRVAEEANRLKDLFVAHVSHEMRAPLNAMLGYVQLLDRESGGRERQRAHLARIQRSGKHLLEILSDLLDSSRLDAGHMPVTLDAARIGLAIDAAVGDAEHAAMHRGIRLVNAVSGSAADLPYWGDEGRVRQILVNLLTNAIKFTATGGHVTISAGSSERLPDLAVSHYGPWVYVRVEDTGQGIAPDRLDLIFESYEQVEPSDAGRGVGLGLAISRRLARLMGGDVTVRSKSDIGSSFFLWLPIAPSDPVSR